MVRHNKVANIATVDSKITSCQHISSERVVPGPGFITFFPWLSCNTLWQNTSMNQQLPMSETSTGGSQRVKIRLDACRIRRSSRNSTRSGIIQHIQFINDIVDEIKPTFC